MADLIKLTLQSGGIDLIVWLPQVLHELRGVALGEACQGSAYVLKKIGLVALNSLTIRVEVDLVQIF